MPLIIGAVFVIVILAGFFRAFWPSRKRDRVLAASDWDNSQLSENITGASGANPPDFGGHGGGHH